VRDVGPWSASDAILSDTSSIFTWSPIAFIDSQRRFGSALVNRYVDSSSRLIVPSSMATSPEQFAQLPDLPKSAIWGRAESRYMDYKGRADAGAAPGRHSEVGVAAAAAERIRP
jgi:hypothetical protein